MDKTFKEQARAAMQDFLDTATTELSRKSVSYVELAKKLVAIKENEFFKVAANDATKSYRTFNSFMNNLDVATENKKILTVCMDIIQELGSHPEEYKALLDKLPDTVANWKALLSARKEDILNILKEAAGIAEEGKKIAASDIKQAMTSLNAVAAKGGFDPFKIMWAMLKKVPPEEILKRLKNEQIVVETQEEAMHVISVLEPIVNSLKEKYKAYSGVDAIRDDFPAPLKPEEPEKPEEQPEPPKEEETQEAPLKKTLGETIEEAVTPATTEEPSVPKGPSIMDRIKGVWDAIRSNDTLTILMGVAGVLMLLILVLAIIVSTL